MRTRKPAPAMPEGIEIEEAPPPIERGPYRNAPREPALVIRRRPPRRHRRIALAGLIGLCLVAVALVVGNALAGTLYASPLSASAIILVTLAVCLPILLRRTTILVDETNLEIRSRPRGPQALYPAAEITQLYCRRELNDDPSVGYELVVRRGSPSHDVALPLPSLTIEQARYLEQRIEERLGIEDRPVRGEAKDEPREPWDVPCETRKPWDE